METGKTIDAVQLQEGYRKYPIDDHGKLRYVAFNVAALTVALPVAGTIGLAWLPPGRKRLLPAMSRLKWSAFGATATLDIGHAEYSARHSPAAQEADDPDAFTAALSVAAASAAGGVAWPEPSDKLWFDMYSTNEVLVYATARTIAMPIGATLSGYLAYLYE